MQVVLKKWLERVMSLPNIEQNYTDSNLRGFLLKGLKPNQGKNPDIAAANEYLTDSVDRFWRDIVEPLREKESFNPDKILWYFEIYKEGLEIRRAAEKPCRFGQILDSDVEEIKKEFFELEFKDYLDLGNTYLANVYTVLTRWLGNRASKMRLANIYNSDAPVEWILTAEKEERGLMEQKPEGTDDIMPIIGKIGLIISMKL